MPGICADAMGTVYVSDALCHNIRRIIPAGAVTTVAGSTTGSPGTPARFNAPTRLAADGAGTLYVPDFGNSTIRVIR
ncbi:hypothetical protein Q5H93_11155 [Hymenobacter sp. ASUV-10]|uniref:SMP-30/Gluconolactonase/LRE-like region domain-containing protein n=1 Tax=Hymenobacter aranciens TaxID=3063996 RepID=A0ABT9BE33_9BACT|nr:hypothetical protein [Hymenobacter sp. ASUV-10]MDO7875292.1 hypothetical protein [Hymenobacter sp. ASUV-10]